jgi:arylsulfatase A
LSLRTRIPAVLCALGCTFLSGACESRKELIRQADARAKLWGYPAPRIAFDLVYAEYGQRQLKLDVYQPPKSDQPGVVPGIIVVRGGAWRAGDKEFFGYIAGRLAMDGFVAASIEYRTSDEAKFPAAVQDVKAAVRWMRAHAVEYGVDPDTIGAIGGSAGAHLVAMLATSGGVKELEGDGGNSEASSDVQAVVAMACGCNLQWWNQGVGPEFISAVTGFIGSPLEAHAEAIAAASPLTYVSSRSAPLLLLHSRTDPDVPFGQSVEMEQRYRSVGAPVMLRAIDAPGVHGFWGDSRYFPETKRLAVEFLRRNLRVPK